MASGALATYLWNLYLPAAGDQLTERAPMGSPIHGLGTYERPFWRERGVPGEVVAAVEGSFGLAKNAASVDVLRSNLGVLADFLETLRR